MNLSRLKTNLQIPLSTGLVYRGCHCPMHTALASLRSLKGVSSLVVGTNECTYYSRLVINEDFHSEKTRHYCYLMSSRETVFGCAKGLYEAVDEMFGEGIEKLLIIMTCVPALIGEDFKALLEPFGEKVKVVDLAHFKRNGYGSGYDLLSEALVEWFVEGGQELPKVNEILQLNEAHYDFKSLMQYSSIIVTSTKWRGLIKPLTQVGVKVYRSYDIWDLVTMAFLLRKLPEAHVLFKTSPSEHKNRLSEHNALAERFLPLGLEVQILNQDVHSLGLAQALHRLGVKVTKIHIEEWHESEAVAQTACLNLGVDPEVVYEADEVLGHRGKVRFRKIGSNKWLDTPRETWLPLTQLPIQSRIAGFYQLMYGVLEHFERGGDTNATG